MVLVVEAICWIKEAMWHLLHRLRGAGSGVYVVLDGEAMCWIN